MILNSAMLLIESFFLTSREVCFSQNNFDIYVCSQLCSKYLSTKPLKCTEGVLIFSNYSANFKFGTINYKADGMQNNCLRQKQFLVNSDDKFVLIEICLTGA